MLLLLLLVARVAAYPRGAPNSQCHNLEPGHGMVPQDNTRTPYSIQVAQVQVAPSSPVDLSLAASLHTFKGFIVQARDQEGMVIGTFVISQGDSKYLHCAGGPQSSVTHRDAREKRRVWLRWLPPAQFRGEVTFLATVVKDYSSYWVGLVSKPVLIEAWKPLVSHDLEEDESELGDMEELRDMEELGDMEELLPVGDMEELQPVLDFFPSMEEQELEELHGTSLHEYDEFLPEEEDEEYGDDYVLGGFGDEFREDYSDEDGDSSPGGWHEDDSLPSSRPSPPPSPVSGLKGEEMEARRKEVEQIEKEREVGDGSEVTDEASEESSVRKEPASTPEDAPKHQPDVAPPPPQYQPDVAPQYQPRPRPHPERRPPTPWWMRGYRSGPPSLAQRGSQYPGQHPGSTQGSQYPGQHSPQYGSHGRHMGRRSVASPYAQAYRRGPSLPTAHRRSPYSYRPYSPLRYHHPYSPLPYHRPYSPLPYHHPYSPLPYHGPYNPSSRFSYRSHYNHRPRQAYQRYGADPYGQSYWRKANNLGTGGRWLTSHHREAPAPGGSRKEAGGGWDQQTRLSEYDGSGSGGKGEEATKST